MKTAKGSKVNDKVNVSCPFHEEIKFRSKGCEDQEIYCKICDQKWLVTVYVAEDGEIRQRHKPV